MLLLASLIASVATVTETSLPLKTYPFSDPDPVPATEKNIYPYTRYNGSSWTSAVRTWKAVELENARIRVVVTPEIGGKVWGAIDKRTGVDFVYFNHVAKFRDIAQCGPWTSGGIEFNFGIVGHSPTCSSPVGYAVRTNDDGSASCFVGATEWICGTTWQVEIRLGADDDFFETRTTWHNGSGFPEPYYQWMNAAFHLEKEARFDFPGRREIFHDGRGATWPRDADGRDLSVYSNNAFGEAKSYHIVDGDNGYYGIWWPQKGLGAYHSNAVSDKYGRKIWLWALSRQGGIWEDLLTDADGQYTELQSGRVFHQPEGLTFETPYKHPTFQPGATDRFTERWGVMRERPKAWDEKAFAAPRPPDMPKGFDWSGVYGLYVRGVQALRTADYTNGVDCLRKCLAKDPHYAPALDELALLEAKRGHWSEAREYARHALAIDTYDAAANYADGLAAFADGDLVTARERLGLAAYSPVYRSAAFVRYAQVEMRRGDGAAALVAAEKALEANPLSPDAKCARIVALRMCGRPDRAKAQALDVLADLPLCCGALYEAGRLGAETDPRERLRLACWYADAGLREDAVALLRPIADSHPVAKIHLAFWNAAMLDDVCRASVAGVRPFLAASRPPLEWAVRENGNWRFRYLLSVLEAANGDADRARALLEACGDAPDDAVFYLYRARFREGAARLEDLRRAQRLGDSWRVGLALCAHLDAAGDAEGAFRVAADYLRRYPKNNTLELLYASGLNATGRHADCVEFLKTVRVLPSEHGRNGSAIWIAANRALAEAALAKGDVSMARRYVADALSYPENLGRGRPFDVSKAIEDWSADMKALIDGKEWR